MAAEDNGFTCAPVITRRRGAEAETWLSRGKSPYRLQAPAEIPISPDIVPLKYWEAQQSRQVMADR